MLPKKSIAYSVVLSKSAVQWSGSALKTSKILEDYVRKIRLSSYKPDLKIGTYVGMYLFHKTSSAIISEKNIF